MKNGHLEIGEPIDVNLTSGGRVLASGRAVKIDALADYLDKAGRLPEGCLPRNGGVAFTNPLRIGHFRRRRLPNLGFGRARLANR